PRQFRHFPIPTQVQFSSDEARERTIVELITADRPGLLSQVGRAFTDCGIRLQNAKIATFGSRAEDVFFITDQDNHPLADSAQFECLKQTLISYLDGTDPAAAVN
ncbi:MAG: [protein-PII] uridylyltransferase, partial [Gammaproteobacteria bacterium]